MEMVCAYVEHLVSEEARQRKFLYDQSEDIKNSKVLENLQSEACQVILAALQSGKTLDQVAINESWKIRYRALVRPVMNIECSYSCSYLTSTLQNQQTRRRRQFSEG